jgi:hypothetical protein
VSQQSISKVQDSIQQISSYAQPVDKWLRKLLLRLRHSQVIHMLDRGGTLSSLEPIKGSERALKRIARSVAIVIGIALSMQSTAVGQGSARPIQSIKQLADYQLTEVQEKCHNDIVYRESRFKRYAVNGSHHGYYQGRSRYLKGKPDDVQFYWYWYYVSSRYGITEYDEPDYCKALHHLRVKGWQ